MTLEQFKALKVGDKVRKRGSKVTRVISRHQPQYKERSKVVCPGYAVAANASGKGKCCLISDVPSKLFSYQTWDLLPPASDVEGTR